MAEGVVEGVLGGEDEKLEAETPEAFAGAEAFAVAVAAIALSAGPGCCSQD